MRSGSLLDATLLACPPNGMPFSRVASIDREMARVLPASKKRPIVRTRSDVGCNGGVDGTRATALHSGWVLRQPPTIGGAPALLLCLGSQNDICASIIGMIHCIPLEIDQHHIGNDVVGHIFEQ